MFIIADEGEKTEPEYFQMLNSVKAVVHFKCLKNIHGSSPLQILKVMKRYIIDTGLKKTDEVWLVVDKDDWVTNHLQQLFEWSQERDHYNFALSNPKFEARTTIKMRSVFRLMKTPNYPCYSTFT